MKNSTPQFRMLAILTAGLATTNVVLAANELWIGNPGVTTTTNWSDTANWSPTGNPNANTVFFGNGVAVSTAGEVNNVVDKNTNCASLNFTNSTGYNTTLIAAGQTLTISNNNGGPALYLFTGPPSTAVTNAVTGTNGTLLISGSSAGGVTVVATNASGAGAAPLLDMSGLGTFIISNAGSSAAINVGNVSLRPGAMLNLAMTNYIVLPASGTGGSAAIVVGEATGNNGNTGKGNVLNLGLTNAIYAGNIGVGLSKESLATMTFNPAFTNQNPYAYIRGPGGSAVTNWAIGDGINTSGTSTTPTGTVNFNNGTVNVVVNAMWLGKPSQTSATAPTAKGTLSFNSGTFSVVNLTNADAIAPTTGGAGAATGTINVNGTGTLAVNNLVMAFLASGALSSTATLNVTNGTLQAGTIVAGGGSSTINLIGATLNLTNTAGAGAQWFSALTVSNSTLQLNVPASGVPIQVTNLTTLGTTDIINIASVPAVVPPAQFELISYSGSISGPYDFGLGTLAGAYQGYISNNFNNSSVDLVITGSVAKPLVWNGNVAGGKWDLSTENWLFSSNPALYVQGDFVTFDDTLTGTPNVALANNVAPGSLGFNNSANNYVLSGAFGITGPTLLSKQGSDSVTLSESGGDNFSGGITVNSGTLILDDANSAISGGLTINGGTVQIGNNDTSGALPAGTLLDDGVLAYDRTDSVSVSLAIAGTGSLVQGGSGTLALSGVTLYSGNTMVNNGTLALSGSGSISNSAAVQVNSATFDVSGVSKAVAVNGLDLTNATINVAANANASANIVCSSLAFGGATNKIDVLSLPPIASYPVTFTIIQSAGAASGTFNVGLGTALPNGSLGNVSQSADQTAVLLTVTSGTVGVRAEVVWTGADLENSDTNWSDRLNWELPGAPTAADNVLFNGTGSQTASELSTAGGGASDLSLQYVDNIVDASFTNSSLTFTNAGSYHNTWINNGMTLSVIGTNSLTVGSGSLDFGGATTESVAIAGTNGTLQVNNTNGTLYVGLGSATSGSHQATLDMSALGTFNAAVSRFLVGVGSSSEGYGEGKECGVVYLAQTNTITASLAVSGTETSDTSATAVALDVGDNDGNGGNECSLYLGQTNAIFADAIVIGRQKTSAQMLFNPIFTAPTAYIRGHDGVSPVGTFGVGDQVVNGGTASGTGIVDFSGGTVNLLASTMYIGRAANSTAETGTATGTLTFAGLLNAGTIYLGLEPTNNASKHGVGTINVVSNTTSGAGATLIVTDSLNMGFNDGGSGSASSSGTLNLTNGVVEAFSIVAGTNTPTTINIAGGTLVLTNPAFSASALGTLTLASLGTPDNSFTVLYLPVRTNNSGMTVANFQIDGVATTTNIINVESVGPIGATPVELPLIQYTTETLLDGDVTNLALGTLPTGYHGFLTNDSARSMVAVYLTSQPPHPQPVFTAVSVQSGTNVTASGTNGFANVPYTLLASTNVTLPLASWTSLGSGIFGPTGGFSISAAVNAATPQQFYILRVNP